MAGMKRLLSFSGGGVMGAWQAAIASGMDFRNVDAFAGTSIGSVMAVSAAMGKTEGLLRFFEACMPQVFGGHWWRQHKFPLPKYNDKELNRWLQAWFGDDPFLKAHNCFITAVKPDGRPKVFESSDPEDGLLPCWEVVRMSCAAPTYFRSWKGYRDGGLWANNPVVEGLCAMKKCMAVDPEDVSVMKVGAGVPESDLFGEDWEYFGTMEFYMHATLYGAADVAKDTEARAFAGEFFEVDFRQPKDWKMDDSAVVEKIIVTLADEIRSARAGVKVWAR